MSRRSRQNSTTYAADAAATYAQLKDNTAWSLISSRPVKSGDAANAPTSTGVSTRLSEVAPFDVVAIRLVYVNWQNAFGSSESSGYNGYRVKASAHKAGTAAPDRAATDFGVAGNFGGREFGHCAPGALLITDPMPIGIKAGERYWHESYADAFLGAGPAAPTLALVAGGALANTTTYGVILTYVYPDGTESLPSAESTITTSTGNLGFSVTAPPAVPGIIGYRVYYGVGTGGQKYENPIYPMLPLGTNATITSAISPDALNRTSRTLTNVGLPVGRGLLGDAGGASLGEASVPGRDYTLPGISWVGGPSFTGVFSPVAVLGLAADGKLHNSVALQGDSIQAGTGDGGYGGALGGFGFRALANQTAQMPYDKTKIPKMGFLTVAQGGETAAAWATPQGSAKRRALSELATAVFDNYGTNDTGSGSAPVYASILTSLNYYAGRKKYFRATIDPKTTSTDGFKTVANQTIANTDAEADRRALNNCIKGATGAVAVTGESLYRSAGTAVPSDNLYSGGNGTATKFFTAYPFRQGTETVKVAGVTKALTTDYTYRGTSTINGLAYASGITFVTAPANAATVTMDYAKIESFGAVSGYSGFFDTAAAVEVNGAGAAGTNGGLWAAADTASGFTSTATSTSSTTVNDTTKAWTLDQWRGMAVIITADAGTPAAVGLVNGIQSNTATQLKLGGTWTITPSATATYQVFNPMVIDGTHGTSRGQMLKSQVIDTTKF